MIAQQIKVARIISGGQTGADQGGLDAAIALGLAHGGWLPKGRRTEAGPLPEHYRLEELASSSYAYRTEQNVLAADGTLILSRGPLTAGSALTEELAALHGRPCLHLDLNRLTVTAASAELADWLQKEGVVVLNVAGPRASKDPEIYRLTMAVLCLCLAPPKVGPKKGKPLLRE